MFKEKSQMKPQEKQQRRDFSFTTERDVKDTGCTE